MASQAPLDFNHELLCESNPLQERSASTDDNERTVVITVIPMWMVQVAIDQVVDVVSMRNRFVTAVGAVNVASIMPAALMIWRAYRRVRVGNVQVMLFNLSVWPHVMQVTIVQIIDVIPVLDSCVFAVGTMNVVVLRVEFGHFNHSS